MSLTTLLNMTSLYPVSVTWGEEKNKKLIAIQSPPDYRQMRNAFFKNFDYKKREREKKNPQ